MKLRFLGQAYFQFRQQIPSIASKNIVCYRGHKYNLRVPMAISPPPSPRSQMSAVVYKYRGISYVVERYKFPSSPNKTPVFC